MDTFYKKLVALIKRLGWVGMKPEEAMDLVIEILNAYKEFLQETEPYATNTIGAIETVLEGLPETKEEMKGETCEGCKKRPTCAFGEVNIRCAHYEGEK